MPAPYNEYQQATMTLAHAIGLDPMNVSIHNVIFYEGVLCVDELIRDEHGHCVDENGSLRKRRRCYRITTEEITHE